MGYPVIDNQTDFAFEPAFLADENGVPLFVPIVKATYTYCGRGELTLADEQLAVNASGELNAGEGSSYKYEPEIVFTKPATDVVLVGHAYADKTNQTEIDVGLRVGPVAKVVRVVGDRYRVTSKGFETISPPQPFEKIPLTYERAFGGWDRRHADPEKHSYDPRNPSGVGFGFPSNDTREPIRLPNIEDPSRLWQGWGDRPPPTGFGFTSPNWHPRSKLAGTYDKQWSETRKPLLPVDFDRRFFNAASAGLVAPGYLRGDEPVAIVNAVPEGKLHFDLPCGESPCCYTELKGHKHVVLKTCLDTVIVNTDESLLILIWRAHYSLRHGPEDVVRIKIDMEKASA